MYKMGNGIFLQVLDPVVKLFDTSYVLTPEARPRTLNERG